MKALILGDIHLARSLHLGKSPEPGQLNSRIQDQIDLLNWAYDYCVQNNINTLISTGDVYQDFRPYPAVINIFMRFVKKCEKAGITFHIVMGNHDIIRNGQYVVSALDLVSELELEGARVYKNVTRVEIDDFTLVFVPFRDKRMYDVKTTEEAFVLFSNEITQVIQEPSNKTKIAIGHLAFEGSISVGDEITDSLNELFVPPDMFNWFDFVWMGHIHHPQVIQHHNPYAAHIGSLDRSDFSKLEINVDKIAILLDSDKYEKFVELKLPTRHLRYIELDVPPGKDSTEFVINELCILSKTFEFRQSIVKLEITLNGEDLENIDREKVESYLKNNLEVFYISVISESRVVSNYIECEKVFDNTFDFAQNIKIYSEKAFEDEKERTAFQIAALEVKQEFEAKYL